MRSRNDLSPEYVRSILDYDPNTGVFTWKYRGDQDQRWNTRYAGKRAGGFNGDYWIIQVNSVTYKAHRIAWLFATGNWPAAHIDHRDTNRTNNKLSNLREATAFQNTRNARRYSNNTSGVKGVTWRKNRQRWVARITVNRKVIFVGMFKQKEDAERAVHEARLRYHGEFARAA